MRLPLFGKKVGPFELFHANNQAVLCDSSRFNLHARCYFFCLEADASSGVLTVSVCL